MPKNLSETEFVIPGDHSALLLNAFYLAGVRRLKVKSFLLNQELFEVNVSDETKEKTAVSFENLVRDENRYEEMRSGFGEWSAEIPTFSGFRGIIYASGILKPLHWKEISKEILEEVDRDPLKGMKPIFMSFDTNALVKCRYTFISWFLRKSTPPSRYTRKPGYVLAGGVVRELENSFEEKYRESDLSAMNRAFKTNREIIDELINQLRLRDRTFRLGHVEHKEMSSNEYYEEEGSERGDTKIISALKSFSMKKNVDVMVYSEDTDFIEKATSNKLIAKRLDTPTEVPHSIEDLNWNDILQLLQVTAISYGALGITGGDTKIKLFGIWRGKKGENWNRRDLKIKTHNETLKTFLEKNLEILEQSTSAQP